LPSTGSKWRLTLDALQVNEPTISVIVPAYRGGEPFDLCLASLQRLSPAPLETLIVVDGACRDSEARARNAGFRVIVLDKRSGPAMARNRGAVEARGDILFFLDADVIAPPDACARVARAFESSDRAALIGSYDDRPAAPNFFSQYKNLAHRFVHQHADRDGFTFWGACGAIRRDVFRAVGGFDARYREASVEDIELGYRLRRGGHRITVDRTLEVTHLKRWTASSLLRTDIGRRALPWSELILQQGRLHNDLNLRASQRIAVALTWLTLAALVAAAGTSFPVAVAGATALALLIVDLRLWRYLGHKRGWWFAVRSIPWHWLIYALSGAAFGWVLGRYLCSGTRVRRAVEPA
jgi:GT2 family glycosyltransferase